MIVATRPDPTVRPPSRIAKVRPCSIAIGWISSMVISTLSPGMHISVPSGRLANASNVSCSEVELRTIVVEERSMTATLIFGQNVNLSGEFGMAGNSARFSKNLSTNDIVFSEHHEAEHRCYHQPEPHQGVYGTSRYRLQQSYVFSSLTPTISTSSFR